MNSGVIAILVLIAILLWVGTGVVVGGVALGVVTTLSFIMFYSCMPAWVQRLMCRIHVILDLAISAGVYAFFGSSHAITGLIGAAVCEVCTTIFMLGQCHKLLGRAGSNPFKTIWNTVR